MIYRVQIKNKEGYSTYLIVEASNIAEASIKTNTEYPGYLLASIHEDHADAILR